MVNKMRRFIRNSFLVGYASLAGFAAGTALSERELRKDFYSDVYSKAEEVIKVQEDSLGIKQDGGVNLYFNPLLKVLGMSRNLRGAYSSFFNATWVDLVDEQIKQVIAHEEGHRYSRDLKGKLGLRNNLLKNLFSRRTIGNKIIDEGIAEYFESVYLAKAERVKVRCEPLDKNGFSYYSEVDGCPVCYYSAGFSLVKPILDVNVDKGIETLIKNPINEEDLEDLIGYQKRILGIVKGKSSN